MDIADMVMAALMTDKDAESVLSQWAKSRSDKWDVRMVGPGYVAATSKVALASVGERVSVDWDNGKWLAYRLVLSPYDKVKFQGEGPGEALAKLVASYEGQHEWVNVASRTDPVWLCRFCFCSEQNAPRECEKTWAFEQ